MKRTIGLIVISAAILLINTCSGDTGSSEGYYALNKGTIVYHETEKEVLLAEVLQKKIKQRTRLDFQLKSFDEISKNPGRNLIFLGVQGSENLMELAKKYRKEDLLNQERYRDGFKIIFCPVPNNLTIIQGDDLRGLLYGIGHFLHAIQQEGERFVIPARDLSDHPKSPVRLGWLATNLHNSHSVQSIEAWDDLLLEYALWGANYIMTFYSPLFGDPLSPNTPKVESDLWYKLPQIFEVARKYMISTVYHIHHNYIFPGEGRWSVGSVPDYEKIKAEPYVAVPWRELDHPKVCLSKKEGMNLVFKKYKWILTELKEKVDCINIHCMDWGGCGCDKCRPFASTYYDIAKMHARQWMSINPEGNVLVDQTWLFPKYDTNSTDASIFVNRLQEEKPGWLFATMLDNLEVADDIPEQYLKTGMMYVCRHPYGILGYQDRQLSFFQDRYNSYLEKDIKDGLMIYTEGIQNNVALTLSLQLSWSRDPGTADNVLEAYVRYYFGDGQIELMKQYIKDLNALVEEYYNWLRSGEIERIHEKGYLDDLTVRTEQLADLAGNIQDGMNPMKDNWRWKLLFQSSRVWKDIARMLELQSTPYSMQNNGNQAPVSGKKSEITMKEAADQLIKDIIIIRKEVYSMPEVLLIPSQVEEDLKKYFKVLNTLLGA